ncbi:cytochrome o ubiquinol oxidase subunit III [Thiomonas bhubaneswarensis]|uniref:Cytochrome bo(3) ubiquinol oxidase subunit 3 n=1 Tax=Thiomonas bhubaneswarensis TaxID=339866 RepID=A0A0K6IAN5_9BURK|nr:cytochrome o ubiquinol oxidase subunit III [Thiomonas bhubaneswarensis]CUB00073.1 cytochrome bo3 quinol oxidase subunit 3 [Thiomonas bhubaneswarensis]
MNISARLHPGLNLHHTDPHTHIKAVGPLFGFWVFLMSDAIIFSLLFANYGVLLHGTAGGPGPAEVYDMRSAFIETMLLLASSFTFGMASLSMKYGRGTGKLVGWLAVTLLLGLGFIAMELRDFATMIAAGAGPDRSGFLSGFFILVSTHGLHVLSGCIWMVVMMVQIAVFGLDTRVKTNLMRLALFWHFLDIIWVGIFSVVYLQGLIK